MGGQSSLSIPILCNIQIGTTFSSSKWLSLDICGLFCVSLSYSLHIYAFYILYTNIIHSSKQQQQQQQEMGTTTFSMILFYTLYIPSTILALCNLYMAQHSNPGVVPLGARPLPIISGSMLCSPTYHNDDVSNNNNSNNISNNNNDSNSNSFDDNDDDGRSLLLASRSGSNISDTNNNSSIKEKGRRRRRGIRRCRKCNDNYKPPRAHHDSVTGRCIVKFDHFCPWVGNAVGALNHKFFFLFVLYTFISSLLSIILLLVQFYKCGFVMDDMEGNDTNSNSGIMNHYSNNNNNNNNNNSTTTDSSRMNQIISNNMISNGHHDNNNHNVRFLNSLYNNDNTDDTTFFYSGCESTYSTPVIFLLIISITFLIFTCCMLFEQIDAIESNTSKIARMKMKMGHADAREYAKVGGESFNEFFGGNSTKMALHWFLPFSIWFPDDNAKDRVMGFEYRDEWYGEVYREDMDEEEDDDDIDTLFINDDIDLELGSRRKHLYGEVELGDVSDHNNAKHSSSYIGSNNSDDVKQRIRVSKKDNQSLRNISEDCNLGCEDSQTTSGSKLSLKIV